jgi:hypothetical protein
LRLKQILEIPVERPALLVQSLPEREDKRMKQSSGLAGLFNKPEMPRTIEKDPSLSQLIGQEFDTRTQQFTTNAKANSPLRSTPDDRELFGIPSKAPIRNLLNALAESNRCLP